MTRLGALLGWKNRFRCRRPRVDLYRASGPRRLQLLEEGRQGPLTGSPSGARRLWLGAGLIPEKSSGAEASFWPLTWQLVCCAST